MMHCGMCFFVRFLTCLAQCGVVMHFIVFGISIVLNLGSIVIGGAFPSVTGRYSAFFGPVSAAYISCAYGGGLTWHKLVGCGIPYLGVIV